MNGTDFDRTLMAWLNEAAPRRAPEGLAEAVASDVRGRRSKGGVLALLTERPMRSSGRVVLGSPGVRAVYVAGLLILVLSLAVGAIAVGARLLPSRPLPSPFGPAANGLVAFDTHAAIFVANADGSGVRPIVSLPGASSPTFSPDGTRLAFYSEPPEEAPTTVYVANADGSNPIVVASNLWISTDKRPSWSPDSRQFVVSAESGPNRNDERLFIISADGSGIFPLGEDHPTDPLRRLWPSWSPDGAWIAFQGIASSLSPDESRLYLIRADGRDEHKLLISARFLGSPASWQPIPTHSKLAFSAGLSAMTQDVLVYDPDTDRAVQISRDARNEGGPAWSPDGQRIAWWVAESESTGSIRIANKDGIGAQATLLANGINGRPAWSPDGTKIYSSNFERTSLIVITLDGSEPPIVVPHAEGQGMPTWQRIAP